jgi:hypothetical protein
MEKIDFKNLPDTNTPINAENLNQLQTNVENEFTNTKSKLVRLYWDISTKGTFGLYDDINNYDLILVFATANAYNHRQMCSILKHNLTSSFVQMIQISDTIYENTFKIYGTTVDTTGCTQIGTGTNKITGIYGLKL